MLLNCGVGEDLESPLDCKEIQLVYPIGGQSWLFIGRTDAEAETPILWPPHAKSWLIGKDSDAGRDWEQEGKGTTEDEMAGWHHWLDGRESEWIPGDGDGQGGLVCCDSRGHSRTRLSDWTDVHLNKTKQNGKSIFFCRIAIINWVCMPVWHCINQVGYWYSHFLFYNDFHVILDLYCSKPVNAKTQNSAS